MGVQVHRQCFSVYIRPKRFFVFPSRMNQFCFVEFSLLHSEMCAGINKIAVLHLLDDFKICLRCFELTNARAGLFGNNMYPTLPGLELSTCSVTRASRIEIYICPYYRWLNLSNRDVQVPTINSGLKETGE